MLERETKGGEEGEVATRKPHTSLCLVLRCDWVARPTERRERTRAMATVDASLRRLFPRDDAEDAAFTDARAHLKAKLNPILPVALAAKLSNNLHALEALNICKEVADLPPAEFMTELEQLLVARFVSQLDTVQRRRPREVRARDLCECLTSENDAVRMTPSDDDPVTLLIVAHFREDVAWLKRLPSRVTFHVVQKESFDASIPADAQTIAPNVGRESHSYLICLQRLLADHHAGRAALPPLIVFAQADPLAHNPRFLDDLATLTELAAHRRAPPWTPLGLWTGEERLIYSDASGAPHQALCLPIERVWSALFPADQASADGGARPAPLWYGFSPGAMFAVTKETLLRCPPARVQAALSSPCGLCDCVDPIAGHVFERLWMYFFLNDDEVVEAQRRFGHDPTSEL